MCAAEQTATPAKTKLVSHFVEVRRPAAIHWFALPADISCAPRAHRIHTPITFTRNPMKDHTVMTTAAGTPVIGLGIHIDEVTGKAA